MGGVKQAGAACVKREQEGEGGGGRLFLLRAENYILFHR